MRKLIERMFFPWSKWEIHKADVAYIQRTMNSLLLGGDEVISEDRVMVDIYCKTHKFNGVKKYRRVIKWQ